MRKIIVYITLNLLVAVAAAQDKHVLPVRDSTAITIDEVEVVHYQPGTGTKTVTLDSLLMKTYQGRTLADILQASGTVYMRQYAPGQLASISMRGGNASQTQLIWNGFNLNNLSLGQTDFSLVPVTLFSGIKVNLGAMGATGGNGVVAGSVELNSDEGTDKGQLAAEAGIQVGSFGKYATHAAFSHRGKRSFVSVKPFYVYNRNRYPYQANGGKEVMVEHAETDMAGALLTCVYRLKRSVMNAGVWWQQSHRNIPATMVESRSYASQHDRSLRVTVNHQSIAGQGLFRINRLGYFYDALEYVNTLFNDAGSGFDLHNLVGETESYWKNGRSDHRIKIFASGAVAYNTNYGDGQAHLLRASLGYFFETETGQRIPVRFSAALKEEINNKTLSLPIAQAGLSTRYGIRRKKQVYVFTALFNLGTVYRFPTLNNLYWNPGGNPALAPEKGASGNVTATLDIVPAKNSRENFLKVEFTHYQRYVYDWIMWLPSGADWTPQNLQEVWSRGNETSVSFQYGWKWKIFSKNLLNYTLSTIQKSEVPNDNSIGRQLIYTPMYNAVTEWGIRYSGFMLASNLAYYGYRYTSSDNYEYLEPFYLLGARFTYSRHLKNCILDLFVTADNLLDKMYYWMAQRPALPRNFGTGITVKWVHTPKQVTNITP